MVTRPQERFPNPHTNIDTTAVVSDPFAQLYASVWENYDGNEYRSVWVIWRTTPTEMRVSTYRCKNNTDEKTYDSIRWSVSEDATLQEFAQKFTTDALISKVDMAYVTHER